MDRSLILVSILLCFATAVHTQATVSEARSYEVLFSEEGGYYEDEIILSLEAEPGSKIYYTIDGRKPSKRHKRFKKPLRLRKTTVIRAIAVKNGRKGPIYTNTYFINEPETQLPTISLSFPPKVLFNKNYGLYREGADADSSSWKRGANFWSRKEVKVHTEIYESDGRSVFNSLSGLRIFGGWSRLLPQKSLALVFRKRYGIKRLKHKIFGQEGLKKFKYLVLRNSGGDWRQSHFRDAMMTGLLEHWDIEQQDYRPAHVYINSRYWGIYNIREKVNTYFLSSYHDVERDSIDLLQHKYTRKKGSRKNYDRLLKFIREHDLSFDEHYESLCEKIEMDNFSDFQIAQIYFDNTDSGGNIKYWRPQSPNGKWRWVVYDTDWGFGLNNEKAYKHNSLEEKTEAEGPRWPNPPWSTFILRNLLENASYKNLFINRFCDHLNTSFHPDRVLDHIDQKKQLLLPEIERHHKRWKHRFEHWEHEVEVMKTFAVKRPKYMRRHLEDMFELGPANKLKLSIEGQGEVTLNEHLEFEKSGYEGFYFEGNPIRLSADPKYGYKFSHWDGLVRDSSKSEVWVNLTKDLDIKAVFEPYLDPHANKVIINEISPNHTEAGDWIELYNNSDELIDISNWIIKDKKNKFYIPQGTRIDARGFVILAQDASRFISVFPDCCRVIGDLNFGLNKRKEKIKLYTSQKASVDAVQYKIEASDSLFTLNLLLPELKNEDLENWEVNKGIGSPGASNAYTVQSRLLDQKMLWIRIGIGAGAFLISMLCLAILRYRRRSYTHHALGK